MPRISPLYHVMSELTHENMHPSTYKVKHFEQDNRNYFLIESNDASPDTHLCIDQNYNLAPNSCYTPIHYTQRYFSKEENAYLIARGFLDAQGNYQYSQVKKLNESKEFTGIYITYDADKTSLFKKNIEKFRSFINFIISEHATRKQRAKQKSDELESTLTDLSRTLNQQSSRQKYMQTATLFVESIKELNNYLEIVDVRDKMVLRIFKHIENIRRCIENTNKSSECKSKSKSEFELKLELEVLPEENSERPEQTSLKDLYKSEIANLKKINQNINNVKSYSIDNLTLMNELSQQMQEQLLTIYSFPDNFLTPKVNTLISNIIKQFNTYFDQYCKELAQVAIQENMEMFQSLFPLLKNHIKDNFYFGLLEMITDNPWGKISTNVLSAFEYLNENDIRYRVFISKVTQETRQSFSKEILSEYPGLEYFDASILIMAFIENKLPFFDMLLRHGVNAQNWGIIHKKVGLHQNLFKSITVLADLNENNYLKYLEILLQHKVDPNIVPAVTADKIKSTFKSCLNKSNQSRLLFLSDLLGKDEFAIKTLIFRDGLEGLNLILDTASLSSLAFCLLYLSRNSTLMVSHLLSSSYGIYIGERFSSAYDEMERLGVKPLGNDSPPYPFISFLCFPYHGNTYKETLSCNEKLKKIEILDRAIADKIVKLSPAEFRQTYQELYTIGCETMDKKTKPSAFIIFLACEFLLMKRAFGLFDSYKDIKAFIEHDLKILHKNILVMIPRECSGMEVSTITSIYEQSQKNILLYSPDKSQKNVVIHGPTASLETKTELKPVVPDPIDSRAILPYCMAAGEGDVQKLKDLLSRLSISIDTTDPTTKGCTPLHYACAKNQIECAKLLILSGANIYVENDKKRPPIGLLKDKDKASELIQEYHRIHPI